MYKNFSIRDVAGVTHSINLSTDPRGLAYDGGNVGLNARLRRPGQLHRQRYGRRPARRGQQPDHAYGSDAEDRHHQ